MKSDAQRLPAVRTRTMSQTMRVKLQAYYDALYGYFGPQQWWPGDTAFEVMMGAVLTQNTNWTNVELAIDH